MKLELAYTINGVKATAFPSKGNYKVKIKCDNATGNWDYENWGLLISNATSEKVKCSVDFEEETFAQYIVDLAETDTNNLTYDGTTDNNLRYIGADPDNYLCFDKNCTNGKWRVIGVMNNMKTATNGTQSLVKIISAESIGEYAWDTNNVNDWTTASLQKSLNSGDLYSTYIEKNAKLFETVTWNLGGTASYTSSSNGLASHWYGYERGTIVYSGRPTTWSGKIGLMYPSDYGYAASGGSTTDRATCLAKELYNWRSSSVSDCKNNDYLYLKSTEWTLTPYSGNSVDVFYVNSAGSVYDGRNASNPAAVRPVGYLISNTKILSGNGSNETPWIIGA
jgi:hypothetical protein